jgi:hypothetical protein
MMDLHGRGAAFSRQIMSDVEDVVRRMIGGITATIAAQQDGTAVSDGHRTLNFQGAGVSVTDNPALRRTDILITGSPATASTVTAPSSTTSKALSLWNGASNNSPPAGWETPGFNDTAWSAPANPAGAAGGSDPAALFLWPTSVPLADAEQALVRQHFTLPDGQVSSATFKFVANDALDGAWINGTLLSGTVYTGAITVVTVTIPIALLVAGGDNVIAVKGRNTTQHANPNDAYVNYAAVIQMNVAGVDTQYELVAHKNAASGYAGLDADSLVPTALLGDGSATSGVFLRGDQTWAAASTNAVTVKEVDAAPTVTATTIRFPNGTLTDDGGGQVTYTPTAATAIPYVNVQDQKAQNTAGGGFTAGADRTRTLNTIAVDTASIASLSANQITLPAGTYRFDIQAPAYGVERHQAWLYNVTDAAVTARGTSQFSVNNAAPSISRITGRMTIAASKTFEVRHRCSLGQAGNGFGVEANFGTEVYTVAEFWKEA